MSTAASENQMTKAAANYKPDEFDLQDQLEIVSAARVGEDQVTWLIFTVFATAQTVLVNSYAGLNCDDDARVIVFAVVGAFTSLVWYYVQDRSLQHLERLERIIEHIENGFGRNPKEESHWLSQPKDLIFPDWGARKAMRVVSLLSAFAWLLATAILSVCLLTSVKEVRSTQVVVGFLAGVATIITLTAIACGIAGVRRR